jgi:prepilin-type N-terminal cleavage/methylation domain-containing protein
MRMHERESTAAAFTLIELLIVVAIIAILALIAVPNFIEAQTRSKIARAKTDMRTLSVALEAYRVDNDNYPPDSGSHGNYEYASWKYLTTPIAYISTILHNPFTARDQGFDPYAEAVFIYGADSRVNRAHGWPDSMWGGIGLYWWMLSAGPDLDADLDALPAWGDGQPWVEIDAMRNNLWVFYDPTNGTASSGDLIRSNKRQYN